jgi:GT2 family glycosyltransferase
VNVRWIEAGESVGARRGDVVVCIPVYAAHDLFVDCLHSVFAHTPTRVRIMICDDASPDERSQEFVARLQGGPDDRELLYLRRERTIGFPANVNEAFAAAAPADVVVLNSDCVVAAAWLDAFRDAAYENSRVATATTLTNHGSIASVPDLRRPRSTLPDEWDFDAAAAAIRVHSRRLRPRLPTAIGHCMFIRRTALELVGDFDLRFTPGYGEEVDFSQRCLLSGLCHVLADDVLVLHRGGASFGSALNHDSHLVQEAHEQLIAARYPYYHDGLRALEQTEGPLSRALNVARRALKGLVVRIDLRGTLESSAYDEPGLLELLRALAETGEVRLSAVLPEGLGQDTVAALSSLPGLELLTSEAASRTDARADVVHRLARVQSIEEMTLLAGLGDRIVLTNVDLTRFHNPAYFEDFQAWEADRTLTRQVMGRADRVVFFSDCARADAVAEGLVEPGRTATVRAGIGPGGGAGVPPEPPPGARALSAGRETILCLGPSLRHTNRIFALRVLEQLQLRHGWEGRLLLVGHEVEHGSSTPDEQAFLAARPAVAGATVSWPEVSRAERAWLFARSRLVLHVAIGEGLEMLPFEAASHDVPGLWAPGTSLSELISEDNTTIVPWDAEASAGRALRLLRDPQLRERNLAATRAVAAGLSWKASAEALLGVYDDAHAMSTVSATEVSTVMSTVMSTVSATEASATDATQPAGLEVALSADPRLGAPVSRALELGHHAIRRMRRRRNVPG